MTIKEINNHLETYYAETLLHIAWIIVPHRDSESTRHLVFSLLELYPNEVATIPLTEQGEKFKGFRIYYQRVKIAKVQDAVNLYRDIQSTATIPVFWDEDGSVDEEILKGIKSTERVIACGILNDYKIWPNLVLTAKKSEKRETDNPFVADIWGAVRTHQLMPDKVDAVTLSAMNHENVGIWLEQYMGWNISYYPELVGSVIMLLPNPYYSSMGIRVIPPPKLTDKKKRRNRDLDQNNKAEIEDSKAESVRVEFTPRRGVDLSVLSVTVFEDTHFGIAGGHKYQIVDNICTIPVIGLQAEKFGCYVKDVDNNLIDYCDFSGFWRKFQMEIHTGGRTKRIRDLNCHDGRKFRDVPTFDKTTTVTGGEDEKPLGKRLTEAAINRRRKKKIEQAGVRYFYKDHEGAEQYIKNLLSNAQDRVIIVDPYAASNELFTYAMNVSLNDVEISIITSKIYLRERSKLPDYDEEGLDIPILGEELRAQIDNYQRRTGIAVKVFVMTGEVPAIHDRFLIVDDTAWFCGGSFNEVGNRLSCVIKLPDSEEISKILMDIENSDQVKTLKEWLDGRNEEENNTVENAEE